VLPLDCLVVVFTVISQITVMRTHKLLSW